MLGSRSWFEGEDLNGTDVPSSFLRFGRGICQVGQSCIPLRALIAGCRAG